MSIDSEQRRFVRMNIDCEVTYRFSDSTRLYHGICKNLSSSGILFTAHQPIDVGVMLEIEVITTDNSLASSMKAIIEVIRTGNVTNGTYEISAEIRGIK